MFKFTVAIIAVWLFVKTVKLAAEMAWSTAKILAVILLAIALPGLVLCLVFAGGAILMIPFVMIAGAFGILKTF